MENDIPYQRLKQGRHVSLQEMDVCCRLDSSEREQYNMYMDDHKPSCAIMVKSGVHGSECSTNVLITVNKSTRAFANIAVMCTAIETVCNSC